MGNNTKRLTPEQLMESFNNYIAWCRSIKRFANVAGFCVYANLASSTYYDYMYLKEETFSETIKRINSILEDETLNAHTSPPEKIFYLKNKCGYKDKQELETVNHNINSSIKDMTDEELEAALKEFE